MQPIFDQRSKINIYCEIIAEFLRKLSIINYQLSIIEKSS